MNFINKTQSSLFLIVAFFVFANFAIAQGIDKNCFEVRHFDFFGLDTKTKIGWSDKEINELLTTDYSRGKNDTSFLIPLIVFQLKDFHPSCNKSIDTERFNKLILLYFKIRQKNVSKLENKTIIGQLNFIQGDYYSQLEDERLLPYMRYTMDDGPLYGEIPKSVPKTKPLESISADFGKLTIIKTNNQIFLTATDKANKRIWSRIMKGANTNRYLGNLEFDKNSIEKTSLATIVHFYSEGERLNLYLKPNGKFLYYFHSW